MFTKQLIFNPCPRWQSISRFKTKNYGHIVFFQKSKISQIQPRQLNTLKCKHSISTKIRTCTCKQHFNVYIQTATLSWKYFDLIDNKNRNHPDYLIQAYHAYCIGHPSFNMLLSQFQTIVIESLQLMKLESSFLIQMKFSNSLRTLEFFPGQQQCSHFDCLQQSF